MSEEGMYRITTANIPTLRGVKVDSLAVYGMGGGMLSERNYETPTADVPQVATEVIDHNGNGFFDDGDELLFWGEGAERWHYNRQQSTWIFEHHAYAVENHYFLTASCRGAKRVESGEWRAESDTTLTTYTTVAHVDNDLTNMYHSGQVWVGEKLTTAVPSRSFELQLPGSVTGKVRLRWAAATTKGGRFSLSSEVGGWSSEMTCTASNPYRTLTRELSGSGNTYRFELTFVPTENSGAGYLDFIELSAEASLRWNGGQRVVRSDRAAGRVAQFAVSDASGALSSQMEVWDVTKAGGERKMTVSGGCWTDSTELGRKYVIFDKESCLTPISINPLENQDLHGHEAAKLVIVTHRDFIEKARELAMMHELMDGITTLVTTDEAVYNEFSSGKQDPMAVRALLRWLKKKYPSEMPRYLLLFGKGSYDNRDLEGRRLPTVVTYETSYSFDEDGSSYGSDDMMGYLDENGGSSYTEMMDVSVGRLPAKNIEEAALMVDKLTGYMTRRDLLDDEVRGDWRNVVALLADDADPGRGGDSVFAHSSEVIATSIKTSMPQLNIDRLYADAYQQESGTIGSYYPDLNNALRRRINYGCLLLNYIGHGSMTYIGTERFIELSDIARYSNEDRLPLMVTSTCSYGRYDETEGICGAEAFVLARGGAIGVISASRPISHVERFNKDVVMYALEEPNTIGDALRKAKNRTAVSPCINLIGDPALRLSRPTNRVRVTEINGEPVEGIDSLKAEVLSRVTVRGEIVDGSGALVSDFDGTVYPVVYDREMQSTTLANDNPGTEVSFWQQKTVLYRGSHEVVGGQFEYSFIVPRDVSYRYDYCKLSHYAKSATEHASGSFQSLMLGGLCDSTWSAGAPEVTLYMGDTNFLSGGLTGPFPTLLAFFSDSAGINVGTGLGHDITAVLDDNANSLIVLNDLYEQDIADSRRGSVRYKLEDLTPGRHTVTVKAWNIFGVSSSSTVSFVVRSSDTLAFSRLTCAPNPATSVAEFSLRVNDPQAVASAELQIYNTYGQMVLRHTPNISTDGFIVGPVRWDVANVPPGLYLARMVVTDNNGETRQITTKCIVR